jgi:hypothetical protein
MSLPRFTGETAEDIDGPREIFPVTTVKHPVDFESPLPAGRMILVETSIKNGHAVMPAGPFIRETGRSKTIHFVALEVLLVF